MGAEVSGAGSSTITIRGVDALHPAEVAIIPDRIEAGTFMAAAAITGGDVLLRRCRHDHLEAVIDLLRRTGAEIAVGEQTLRVRGPERIASVDLQTLEYPGFPTDMQAQFMALMSVAGGTSRITETIFENRMIHVAELHRMGASIAVRGNTALVHGVPYLSGAPVMATDLRASASLVLAGLKAQGTTTVQRVYHLDRGYEALERKFARLGAAIQRV
jgi:UDP-N-acetylglucosamine 1-carboxyvinyltransferase